LNWKKNEAGKYQSDCGWRVSKGICGATEWYLMPPGVSIYGEACKTAKCAMNLADLIAAVPLGDSPTEYVEAIIAQWPLLASCRWCWATVAQAHWNNQKEDKVDEKRRKVIVVQRAKRIVAYERRFAAEVPAHVTDEEINERLLDVELDPAPDGWVEQEDDVEFVIEDQHVVDGNAGQAPAWVQWEGLLRGDLSDLAGMEVGDE
jgi:hypothetical protein